MSNEAPKWNPDRLNESRLRLDDHHVEQTRVYRARGIAAKLYLAFPEDQERARMNAMARGATAPVIKLPSLDDPTTRLAVYWDTAAESGTIGLAMMWRTPQSGEALPKFNMYKLDVAWNGDSGIEFAFDFDENDYEIMMNFADEVNKLENDGLIEDLDSSLLMIVDSQAPNAAIGGLPHNSF